MDLLKKIFCLVLAGLLFKIIVFKVLGLRIINSNVAGETAEIKINKESLQWV